MIIDKNVSNIEKIKFYIDIIERLIRGNIKFLFHKKKSYKILIGRHTKIKNKKRIHFNGSLKIADYVELDGLAKKDIYFGDNISLGKYTIMRGSGRISELGKGIKIGHNFGCGDFCFFGSAGGIEIGDDVIMGQNVRFHWD